MILNCASVIHIAHRRLHSQKMPLVVNSSLLLAQISTEFEILERKEKRRTKNQDAKM